MTVTTGVGIGSDQTGNPPPATGVSVPPATGSPGQDQTRPWFEGLTTSEGTLQTLQSKKWDGLDNVVKSYNELQAAYSAKVTPNVPKSPTDYTFKAPKNLPEGAYSNELVDAMRPVLHKHGVSQDAAAAIHDAYTESFGNALTAATNGQAQKLNERIEGTLNDLTKAWGPTDSPAFKRNIELAKRTMDKLEPGLKDALIETGVIVKVGGVETVANAKIFAALAKAGDALYAEDTLHGTPASTTNPFDPKTADMAAQSRLIKEDPDKARLLIQAAGPETVRMYAHFLNRK